MPKINIAYPKGDKMRKLILLSVIVLSFSACTLSDDITYFECQAKAKAQSLEFDWGPLKGCMVKVNGQWVDYNRFRVMN